MNALLTRKGPPFALLALAALLGVAGCDNQRAAPQGTTSSTTTGVTTRWELVDARKASGAARVYTPLVLDALRARCVDRYELPNGQRVVRVGLRVAADGAVRDVRAEVLADPPVEGKREGDDPQVRASEARRVESCVTTALSTLRFGAGPFEGAVLVSLFTWKRGAALSARPIAEPLRGAVRTWTPHTTVEIDAERTPSAASISTCLRGTYTLDELRSQHVPPEWGGEDPKRPRWKAGIVFELAVSFTNRDSVPCYVTPLWAGSASGEGLPIDGDVVMFREGAGTPQSTPVGPGETRTMRVRQMTSEGSRVAFLGGLGRDAAGSVQTLVVNLDTGESRMVFESSRLEKRVDIAREIDTDPGPAPPPVAGAMWTFPTTGQTERPRRAMDGKPYPAERDEPYLAAADGTTFVERWWPPRVECLNAASGVVRWVHPMQPPRTRSTGPSWPGLVDARMRLVTRQGELVLVEPRGSGDALVLLQLADGSPAWERPLSGAASGMRFADGGSDRIFGTRTGERAAADTLTAYARKSGEVLWEARPATDCPQLPAGVAHEAVSAPIAAGDARVLLVSSCEVPERRSIVTMVDATKGTSVWQRRLPPSTVVVLAEGSLYAINGDEARALERESGRELGTKKTSELPEDAVRGSREPALARERTPLADGKTVIVRDAELGRLARAPR